MKKLFLVLLLGFSFATYAQDLKDYFGPVYESEQKLQKLTMGIYIGGLSPDQFQKALRESGLGFDLKQAARLKSVVQAMESEIMSTHTVSSIHAALAGAGFPISVAEAQIIYNHVNGGSKLGPNAHVYLISLVAAKAGITLKAYYEVLVKEAQRPANPNSPTSVAVQRVIKRGLDIQRIIFPQTSGEDWLGDAYTQVNTYYSTFDNHSTNGSGNEKGFSFILGGEISENTSISFSAGHANSRISGTSAFKSESYGVDALVHHKLNENYGVGIFGFYQQTDIEDFNSNAYGYGGGLMFTTYHDFEHFYLSTVHTLNKAYYDLGHDQLYVGSAALGKYWTDKFSTALTAAYVDSLKSDQVGDNSYWIFWAEISYDINENATIILGYDRTAALKDYRSHTYQLNFIWNF